MKEKNNREFDVLSLRPIIPNVGMKENSSVEENFQNITLRPIIKFQHLLLQGITGSYLKKYASKLRSITPDQAQALLSNLYERDQGFKHRIIGAVTALFTISELKQYFENEREINKRILKIVRQRFLPSHFPELTSDIS